MKARAKIDGGYNQMRWVVLLLAIAVVLPAVCLLWFMTQVVRNERLAVRQKLITVYQKQLAGVVRKSDGRWSESCKFLDRVDSQAHPYSKLPAAVDDDCCDGLIIYDALGDRVYPLSSVEAGSYIELSEVLGDAWKLEFVREDFRQAAELYEQKAMYGDDHLRLAALTGESRCLAKLGELDEAIEQCKQVAFSPLEEDGDARILVLIRDARLLLMKLMGGNAKYDALSEKTFSKLVAMAFSVNRAGTTLSADQNVFLAQKILDTGRESSLFNGANGRTESRMEKLMSAEERSVRFAEHFPIASALGSWEADKLYRLQAADEVAYGLYRKKDSESVLLLLSLEHVASILVDYENNFRDSYVVCRILDDAGYFVTGFAEPEGKPFATASAGKYLPDWRIELYFKGGDVFKQAASDQIAVYIWTGVLVIVLILGAGGFAGRAVARQMKLNKLKNDFIATVSHELKTPLSSMRVLVDTVLEGNYRDQQQVTEYLQLVSQENERLSRLIDNFLTFSRMERNKQAFVISRANPATIARSAAEAVKTKFSKGRCQFEMSVREDLPDVLADHDAMVTVLVNLLDNAYKYSYDDKKIELRVFNDDSSVCFCVCDRGAGMSRRAAKKIFKRFYQADRSLARRAEGCGLGLSIAKFIVDAHKGTISVESKLGEGSTFTVRLPAVN